MMRFVHANYIASNMLLTGATNRPSRNLREQTKTKKKRSSCKIAGLEVSGNRERILVGYRGKNLVVF